MNFEELVELLIFYFKLDEDIETVWFRLGRPPPTKEDKTQFFRELPATYIKSRLDEVFGINSLCHKCFFYDRIGDTCITKYMGYGCVHSSQRQVVDE